MVSRWLIPTNVDLTPAFERNQPAFTFMKCQFHEMPGKKKLPEIKAPPPLKFRADMLQTETDNGRTFITAGETLLDSKWTWQNHHPFWNSQKWFEESQ